jgi:hypothetical protein
MRQAVVALADLLEAGAASYVAHLLELGYTQDQIYGLVADRFQPLNPTPNTIYAAINRGLQAWEAGATLQLGTNPLTAGQLAPPMTGCLGWRYTVIMDVTDSQTGQVQTIQFQIDSPVSVSFADLQDYAAEMTQQIYESAQAGSRYLEIHPGFTAAINEVLAVERACI